MKAFLMHRDRDFDLEQPLPPNAEALEQDLELGTILDAMARGDDFLREVARRTLLTGLADADAIRYRQDVLADCLEHPALARRLYEVAIEGILTKRQARFFWYRDSPDALLAKSRGMLRLLADVLVTLRTVADEHAADVRSEGLTELFARFQRELDDAYLRRIDRHLDALRFRRGTLVSAGLGRANRGSDYVLRAPRERGLLERISPGGPPSYSFAIADRDEHGLESLAELRGRGIASLASALAQSTDHILGFFGMLRSELAFYVGCLNLHEDLAARGASTCFPEPRPPEELELRARALYDVPLVFHLDSPVVGNEVDAAGKRLVLVTGANQGGKSTFLRSVGVAQLMSQAGMFAGAASLRTSLSSGVFTHYKREEDASMTHGKLDEELARMSELADLIRPGAVLLCNESFASTNEREGSEIARQVVRALVESGVRIVFVTHLFDLADGFHRERGEEALFLRAERQTDGTRTFRVVPGAPLPTSHGGDSFRRVFGLGPASADAAACIRLAGADPRR